MAATTQTLPFSLDDCHVQIKVEKHYETRAFQSLFVEIVHPTIRDIGHISGTIINRRFCRGEFLTVMDDESDELHQFSVKLFDKNGMVKPEIVDHEFHKGSGVWGRELNHGMMIYVDTISVKPEYQHAGVGSWMLQQLQKSQHVGLDDFIFGWPTPIDSEAKRTKKIFRETTASLVKFFGQNGFRRIGKTNFFGYSPKPTHPSRLLPIASDADGYFTPILDDDEEETPAYDPAIRDHTLMTAMAHEKERVRRTKYPLQYALSLTAFCGDIPLEVSALYSIPKAPPIRETILKVSKETPELVRVRDEFGWTPLHAAASTGNYEALDILLSDEITGGTPWDLSDRENVSGRTPLECAESEIRGDKEFKATMLEFDQAPSGALDPQMKCVWRLKKEMGQDVGDVDEYIRKNRWGCTCGKCTGGWFSPRMRFRLQCSADMIGDMMTDLRPDFRRRDEPNELYLVIGLDSLPKPLKANMSAPFYDGLQFVYKEAASILTQPDRIPTCSILREASKLGAYGYYSRGGEPQYALEAVVEMSSDQSPLGDNTFEEYELEGWSELPVCENDLEFKTVRIKLGLPAYPPRVGFDAMGEFDDEDEDEDEDDEDE